MYQSRAHLDGLALPGYELAELRSRRRDRIRESGITSTAASRLHVCHDEREALDEFLKRDLVV